MATGIQISPSSDITIGTTPISSGTNTRVLFQAGGVIQQSQQFTFEEASNAGILRIRQLGNIIYDLDARTAAVFNKPIDVTGNSIFRIATAGAGNVQFRDAVTSTSNAQILTTSAGVLMDFNGGGVRRVRIDSRAGEATLQVRAAGALSTDIAFRVRNSVDTIDTFSFRATGGMVNRMNAATEWWQTNSADGVHRWELGFSGNLPFMSLGGQDGKPRFGFKAVSDAREYALGIKGGYSNFALGETFASGLTKPNEANTNTMYVFNGTAPTLSAADSFNLYSADITAGNAAPHFRTENGSIIKLYKETTAIGGAGYVDGVDDPIRKDTTISGYTMDQVVKALLNFGLLS